MYSINNIRNTDEAVCGKNTPQGHHTDQGMYCRLSTVSEVFLVFITQLYSYLSNYNAIFAYTGKREVLQQNYSQPPILPSHYFRWVVNHPDSSMPATLTQTVSVQASPLLVNRTEFLRLWCSGRQGIVG